MDWRGDDENRIGRRIASGWAAEEEGIRGVGREEKVAGNQIMQAGATVVERERGSARMLEGNREISGSVGRWNSEERRGLMTE